MKKFYALAAAAMMAVAANAQDAAPLYITGDGDFVNGTWNAQTPDEFTYADGVYTYEVTNLVQFKISTTKIAEGVEGDAWVEFNAGCLDCGSGYGKEAGVAVALVTGGTQNIVAPWKGDYTITVAGDLSTITLTTTTEKPSEDAITPIYFRGDMNGWGSPEEWQFTPLSNNVYKFVCAEGQMITAGENFKIADANWSLINIGFGAITSIDFDSEVMLEKGSNPSDMSLAEDFTGVCFVQIEPTVAYFSNDVEGTECPFEVEGASVSEIELDNNASAQYYNLQGVRVNEPANGLYIVVKGGKATKVVF